MSGDFFTSAISSVLQTFQVTVLYFKMCSVCAHLCTLALKKTKQKNLALLRKAERFFHSNSNHTLPNFTGNLFLLKECPKNNCFQYNFYLLSYVFHSGMALQTILQKLKNQIN